MAEAPIQPITPKVSPQAEAAAGNSAAIFTATERKLIEEMGGNLEGRSSFIDALKNRPLTTAVETEPGTLNKAEKLVDQDKALAKVHHSMVKHANVYTPRERVEITGQTPEAAEAGSGKEKEQDQEKDKEEKNKRPAPAQVLNELARELNLDANAIYDKFALEQHELISLVTHVKDLHLKRLLSENEKEFELFSRQIETAMLASVKPEAHVWLKAQLSQLRKDAALYKLKFLESLQAMHLDDAHRQNIKWLRAVCEAVE